MLEFAIGGSTKHKRLDKERGIPGKSFRSEVRAAMSSRIGEEDFDMKMGDFAEDTPETLKFGLRYMAEQAAFFRPTKRKKRGPLAAAQARSTKLFAITTEATFKTHFSQLLDKNACVEGGAELLGDFELAAKLALEMADPPTSGSSSSSSSSADAGASWTGATKKRYGGLVYSRLKEAMP